MKILVVSDKESGAIWDYYEPGKLDNYDLIISCGDLAPQYLSFLATFSKAPVLYVHGNHDDCYADTPPEGCTCIDGSIYRFRGLRILGLGGSMQYRPGINQYNESMMKKRIRKLRYQLWKNKGFDILVTHAPAKGLGDCDDLPHSGFESFLTILDRYKPAYFLHGHVHTNYSYRKKHPVSYGSTHVINVFETYELELEEDLAGFSDTKEK